MLTAILSLMKVTESPPKGRKHCGKRRNCSLRAISPFPTVFSKDLNCKTRINKGLFGKGLKHLLLLRSLKPLLNDKILALSKMKAFPDKNFNVLQTVQFFFDTVENIVEKGENAGDQHFLLFLQCFHKSSP